MNVLIVDDEAHIRSLVINLLPANMGLRVIGEAANGREALEKCQKYKPEVVITDIRMPEMDGLGLAERIAHAFPGTKVVIISGHDDFEYARSAMRWGAIGYLLKPIDEKELADVLGRAARLLKQEKAESNQLASAKQELHKMQDVLTAGGVSGDGQALPANESPIICEVMDFIHNNYNQNISLEDISGRLYMNSAYLSRLFKEKTGTGFQDALTEVRMAKAKSLLELPLLKVREISEMVGYRDVGHFTSTFKQHTGLTPSEYRMAVQK